MLHIYTDGSCQPNPGPGGYAALILLPETSPIVLQGYEPKTTNNRMEFCAIWAALSWLTKNGSPLAMIHSDSQYCLQTIESWVWAWEKSGWRKAKKNLDVIKPIHELRKNLSVQWRWVRGHNGDFWNEQADYAAEAARNGKITGHQIELITSA